MKKKILLMTLFFSLGMFGGGAKAVEPSPNLSSTPLWSQRCSRIEARVRLKVQRFETLKERRVNAYLNMKDRVAKFINRLEKQGYDVSKLKEDLKVLEEKINKFAKDYSAFINTLKESQSYGCGHSEGQFKAKLEEARSLLRVVFEDVREIKNYYRTVIRPDLQTLRQQKPTST